MSESSTSRANKDSGFQRRDCPLCQRRTWHHKWAGGAAEAAWICTDHSAWPPLVKPNVAATVTAVFRQGSLKREPQWHGARDRRPVTVPSVRALRSCGHYTQEPFHSLCAACLTRLLDTPCPQCHEGTVPLPPCDCQRAFTWDGKGRDVRKPCQYCLTPTPLWGVEKVLAGRWGKVLKATGRLDAAGNALYEEKIIPFLRTLEVCGACVDDYRTLVRLTVAAKGRKALAFLPL